MRGRQVRCPRCQTAFAVPAAPVAPAEPAWYIARNKQKVGPYTMGQLHQLAASAQLARDEMVLQEGQGKWLPAASVQGLFPAEIPVEAIQVMPAAPAAAWAPAPHSGNLAASTLKRPMWPWLAGGGAFAAVLLAVGALFLTGAFGSRGSTDKDGDNVKAGPDLSFIAADFNAALIVHPSRILASPVLAKTVPPAKLDEMVAETGIDPRLVERALVLLEPAPAAGNAAPSPVPPGQSQPAPASPNVPFIPGTILRFSAPVDGQAILTKNLGPLESKENAGKKYFASQKRQAGMPLAGHVANDRTVLIAPEPTLQKMMSAGAAKSPLLDRLRSVDLDNDVVAVGLLEPYMRLAGPFLQMGAAQLPPDLAGVKTMPDKLKAATLLVNLNADPFLKLTLETDNADSAAALQKLFSSALDFVRQVYPQAREALAAQLPPDAQPKLLAVTDQINGGITVSQDAERVTVTVKRPPNW
jgi:hypothetical protein